MQEKKAACSAPKDEALLNINGTMVGDKLPTLRISLYENCMDALEVNQTNILQHISNLNKSFKQYDSFYDIAKNPPASDPNSHGSNLGYSIYGEGEGQVNLEKRLEDVITDIEANGATDAIEAIESIESIEAIETITAIGPIEAIEAKWAH